MAKNGSRKLNVKWNSIKAFMWCWSFLFVSSANAATWTNKTIVQVQPGHASTDCYYFTLQGVSQADPVVPGSPWFAINRNTNSAAKELLSGLVAAHMSGRSVTVYTSGQATCGYAEVVSIIIL
jgi:hypothetical protein